MANMWEGPSELVNPTSVYGFYTECKKIEQQSGFLSLLEE